MKQFSTILVLLSLSSTVFASHPHQAVCIVNGNYKDGGSASFLLQMSSERTYQKGDPNKDIYEYNFQARICDDDNDSGQCTTYKSQAPITSLSQRVTLVGLKNSQKVLFDGIIASDSIKGDLVKTESKDDKWVRTLKPFESKVSCILQTWVEFKAEDDSSMF